MTINRLVLRGNEMCDSVVELKKGLNIIYGPSDTGKSLIAEFINYTLGGSKLVDKPQIAKKYQYSLLEVCSNHTSKIFTIARNIDDNKEDCYISECPISDFDFNLARRVDVSNKKKEGSFLSSYLLSIINCDYENIYSNKQGKTKRFSFRNFARLTHLDENRISEKTSIIFATSSITSDYRNIDALAAINVILTGTRIEKNEGKDIVKQKIFKEGIIHGIEESIAKLQKQNDLLSQKKGEIYIDSIYDIKKELTDAIQTKEGEIQKLSNRVLELKSDLHNEKLSYLKTKNDIERLQLLRENYLSDKKRLEFINQANTLDSELIDCKCPICGSIVQSQSLSHEFTKNVKYEIKRINALVDSISNSLLQLENLKLQLTAKMEEIQKEIEHIENNKTVGLVSEVNKLLDQLNLVTSKIYVFQKLKSNKRIINQQELRINELRKEIDAARQNSVSTNLLNEGIFIELCEIVKKLLVACCLISPDAVIQFDKTKMDIIINGQNKESFGQGVRAIINSLFAISIMKFCSARNLCHPNIVLLDSPISTYYDEKNEDIEKNMDYLFYKEMEKLSNQYQIIICENREPIGVHGNIVHFTRNSEGRYGFIV